MPGSRPERLDRHTLVVAALLSATAGAVDVLAFTRLGHAFASVITGNVVVVGAGVGQGDPAMVMAAGLAVLAYGMGVVIGSLTTRRVSGSRYGRAWLVAALELGVLGGLAVGWMVTSGSAQGAVQIALLVLAAVGMGLQSPAFAVISLPGITTTYFTGTLTGLLTGLVVDRRLNGPALAALGALLLGALTTGVLLVADVRSAGLLPPVLLGAVLVLLGRRRLDRASH